MAFARSGRALGRRFFSGTSGLVPFSLRLEPVPLRSSPLLSGFRIVTRQALALVRQPLTVVRESVSLVRDPLAFIRDLLALVRKLLASIVQALAHLRHPLRLIRDLRGRRRISVPIAAATLAAQPCPLPLKVLIIGAQLRRSVPNLQAKTLDVDSPNAVPLLVRAGAQLPQFGAVPLELHELTL